MKKYHEYAIVVLYSFVLSIFCNLLGFSAYEHNLKLEAALLFAGGFVLCLICARAAGQGVLTWWLDR